MIATQKIRSCQAFFLLLIFLFSITPKRFLHSHFAHHTDSNQPVNKHTHEPVFSVAGFHCDCNDVVTASPYLFDMPGQALLQPLLLSSSHAPFRSLVSNRVPLTFTLRGPPAPWS